MVEVEVVGEVGWSFNLEWVNADNPKVVFELVVEVAVAIDIEDEVKDTFEVAVAIEFDTVAGVGACCCFNFDAIAETL